MSDTLNCENCSLKKENERLRFENANLYAIIEKHIIENKRLRFVIEEVTR